ncbi:hypothetical protein M0805_007212 [Coniferiporia weirii]|nr:hypothetical protein M0805_007212 [Coniferiporia weirii]
MPASAAELKASLEGHNAEFEALLRLIPAKYYLVPEDTGEQSTKYQKNKSKQKAPKQAIKEATKKAKRDKLDPANDKSIVELQEEAAKKKAELLSVGSKKKGKGKAQSDESGSDADDLELDMGAMDVDEEGDEGVSDEDVEYKPMEASGSVEVLRAKLRARVEELRQKKGPKNGGGSDAGSRDELLEERRQQRAAMRERRRKETRERRRREEEERGRKGKGKDKQATSGPQTQNQLIVPDVSPHASSQDPSSKYTNIAFSTLSGSAPAVSKSLKTSSNPTQALAQLAKRAEARAGLPADKQKELATRETWAKAGARVAGAKVHDDTARLQKSIKRREREKVKSKKGWEERKEQLVAAQAAKQKKRTDNIATRNDRRKGGSGKKDTKKRPGFEGKSFGGGGAKKAAAGGKGKRGK